ATIQVCAGEPSDATIIIPLRNIRVLTSPTHCQGDYAESDLCRLHYKRPTYVQFTWPKGLVKRVALVANSATVKTLRPLTGANPSQQAAYFSVTPTSPEVSMRAGLASIDTAPELAISPQAPGVISATAIQRDITPVEGDISVSLKRSASFETD